ncbi:hypothetical protein F0562_005359 [Nyssa sinensis]|uniref:Homeobox domain-containing protein n=1 Tax=Nyssa sinensis TaxID=561372 RepID=A0A5J5AMP0_9ASTE|nr:hypothetical protein F0562_005359 [Nyssa sinensis]
MDSMSGGNGSGSGDDHEASNSRKGRKYHRHTAHQTQQLEAFFKECPHPDENQRRQLGRELELEPMQIKFWFQNKRTQKKAQNERADNSALRAENERIQCENVAIRDAINNATCPACSVPPIGERERQPGLEELQMENLHLKREHERVSNIITNYLGKSVPQILSLDSQAEGFLGLGLAAASSELDIVSVNPSNPPLPYQMNGIQDMEKLLMVETAASAMDELIKLLQVNEPVWIKSSTGGRYFLHSDSYDKLFPRVSHFKSSSAQVESSKYSGVVMMSGSQLADMFLDSDKWVDVFPTIVTKATTIEVLDTGMSGHQDASLQLACGWWLTVSYDCSRENPDTAPLRTWKLPSGCMIQDMSNGYSRVTWVEHVEVDDKSLNHRLFRDLVCNSSAYGAERWVITLQRTCERAAYALVANTPNNELGGVINMPEGRRSLMKLSHRMVKNFCSMLSMSDKLGFPHLSELNNCGVRISVRKSDESGQPDGVVVSAATSLWLPLSCETLFNFFRNQNTRAQWDVLSYGNPVHEIANISSGPHPGNCVSVIQPFVPHESNMLMLQENCMDSLGSLIVYAPIDIPAIRSVITGEDSTCMPILPSGFVISGDGRPERETGASTSTSASGSSGSLLTVAFQILVCCSSSKQLNMESVATVNTLISSTVQKIKAALGCSNID